MRNYENINYLTDFDQNIFLQEQEINNLDSEAEYILLKNEINLKISSLKQKILSCNPIELLHFTACSRNFSGSVLSFLQEDEQPTASPMSIEDIAVQRLTEYVQSVLTSSTPLTVTDNLKNQEEFFYEIQSDFITLYQLIHNFYFIWGIYLKKNRLDLSNEDHKFIFESQLLYQVRGNRHQIYEVEYIDSLLKEHNAIFKKLFNISSNDIVEGYRKFVYSLSQGGVDAMYKIAYALKNPANSKEIVNDAFGVGLNNVSKVTGWPQNFIDSLSWKLGEETSFFSDENFPGWPIIDLPISKRPFIIIDGVSYCFDYYSFVDNFYRAIQKAIRRLEPKYNWGDRQQIASENMVEAMFHSILPGCITSTSNYYYPYNKKDHSENDLLVQYDDTLIIVEVKAGSFVFTAPINDYESHINSYKSLIEKADNQCDKMKNYLLKNTNPKIYDSHKNVKKEIDMSNVTKIYTISVTMDNINSVAAKSEKISFLQLKSNTISIAIDDLMIYRDYFESPLVFLHFLKERKLATNEPKLIFNDEMDHLGMYIAHNCYHLQADQVKDNVTPVFVGYREEIDQYFSHLYHPSLKTKKPRQDLPSLFLKIINYLDQNQIVGRSEFINCLLDYSSDTKLEFCDNIDKALARQQELGRELIIKSAQRNDGHPSYNCFTHQQGIKETPFETRRESTLATLLWNGESERYLIDFYFNSGEFIKLEFHRFCIDDIKSEEKEKLKEIGKTNAQRLIHAEISKNKKIKRNDKCPCASGKKYKNCCLNRKF